jgi:anti-anti-sigma regulatory factor
VVPDKNLSYSNVEYFKERVMNSAAIVSSMDVIVIDGSFIHSIDTTTIKVRFC